VTCKISHLHGPLTSYDDPYIEDYNLSYLYDMIRNRVFLCVNMHLCAWCDQHSAFYHAYVLDKSDHSVEMICCAVYKIYWIGVIVHAVFEVICYSFVIYYADVVTCYIVLIYARAICYVATDYVVVICYVVTDYAVVICYVVTDYVFLICYVVTDYVVVICYVVTDYVVVIYVLTDYVAVAICYVVICYIVVVIYCDLVMYYDVQIMHHWCCLLSDFLASLCLWDCDQICSCQKKCVYKLDSFDE